MRHWLFVAAQEIDIGLHLLGAPGHIGRRGGVAAKHLGHAVPLAHRGDHRPERILAPALAAMQADQLGR